LPATEVDPHQMQQVFLNIINNARQAIEGFQPSGWLADHHRIIGWARADHLPRQWPRHSTREPEENFQSIFTTKEVGKGTGLGLSLCYGIVSEHGGTITPHSTVGQALHL